MVTVVLVVVTRRRRRRRRSYHGFHVLRDSGVPRVPANGTTVDCEQLREDDHHVLEHH